ELDEQHATVAGSPEVAQLGQPNDAQVDPRTEHDRNQSRREPREAEEGGAAQRRSLGPDDEGQLYEPADPEGRGRQVRPVGELRAPRRAGAYLRMDRE